MLFLLVIAIGTTHCARPQTVPQNVESLIPNILNLVVNTTHCISFQAQLPSERLATGTKNGTWDCNCNNDLSLLWSKISEKIRQLSRRDMDMHTDSTLKREQVRPFDDVNSSRDNKKLDI